VKVLLKDLNNGYDALMALAKISARKEGTTPEARAQYYYRLGNIYRDARAAIDTLKEIEARLMVDHKIFRLPSGAPSLLEGADLEGFNCEMVAVINTQYCELYGHRFTFHELSQLIDLDELTPRMIGDLLGWLIEDDPEAVVSS